MARRDSGTKAVRPDTGVKAKKNERKFSLTQEAWRRLGIHVVWTGQRPAAIVEALILTHLPKYVVSDRGVAPSDGRAGEGSEVA